KNDRKSIRDRMTIQAMREAVNGAAFLNGYAIATSRSEVIVVRRGGKVAYENNKRVKKFDGKQFAFGGHNAIAIPDHDAFLVSIDRDGIAVFRPTKDSVRHAIVVPRDKVPIYQLARIGKADSGAEIIVSACRRDGVLAFATDFERTPMPAVQHQFPGADV